MKTTTVLITTGGTTTFKRLLDEVTRDEFFDFMSSLGVKKVYIQYGNEIIGEEHISQQYISQLLAFEGNQGRYKLIDIELFAFSNTIDKYIESSDLILTHGGTGSILDCLRLNKKVIVIPNETLMNNHQVEIANAFESNNYLKSLSVSDINTTRGHEVIQGLLSNTIEITSLPNPNTSIIDTIIAQELK